MIMMMPVPISLMKTMLPFHRLYIIASVYLLVVVSSHLRRPGYSIEEGKPRTLATEIIPSIASLRFFHN